MARMVEHYLNLLTDALARPAAGIDELGLLTDAESRPARVVQSRPGGRRSATRRTPRWPALFAAQVARDPDAIALVFGDRSVTYAEFDRRSNALAWLLRRRGVGMDVPVGVAIERGLDLVVALLAVVKAGGAYLPIELGHSAGPGRPRWSRRPGPGWC